MITLQSRGQLQELAGRAGGVLPPAPPPAPAPEPTKEIQPAPEPTAPRQDNTELLLAIKALGESIKDAVRAPWAPSPSKEPEPVSAGPKPELIPMIERAAEMRYSTAPEAADVSEIPVAQWSFQVENDSQGLLQRVIATSPGRATQTFNIERSGDNRIVSIKQSID